MNLFNFFTENIYVFIWNHLTLNLFWKQALQCLEYFQAVIALMFILLDAIWCSNIRTVAKWKGILQKP